MNKTKKSAQKHQILLYYKYTSIKSPKKLWAEQMALCKKLNLTGRILIAKEGINGTVEGTTKNTNSYIKQMRRDKRFADIDFKKSAGTSNAFPKLSIKVKKEIVRAELGKDDVNPNKITGKKLKPTELHKWFKNKKDFTIIDMRNDYEYNFGHFEGSVDPKMENFRDLPKKIPTLKPYKNQTVLTVCTGGVRCEKASGYLVKKGFKDVYQLEGGIVRYMEKYPGENFVGSLFVFDDRQMIHFDDKKKHKIVAMCDYCKKPTERMCNCSNSKCNAKIVACPKCVKIDRTRLCLGCEKK